MYKFLLPEKYKTLDMEIKHKIYDLVSNDISISPSKVISTLKLERTNTILGYIGKVKRDLKCSTTRES